MHTFRYLMENAAEPIRLDLKTDPKTIARQALWAGIKPGLRVADLGCGPGKTTYSLNRLVQPDGAVIGVDFSEERITYAKKHYSAPEIKYICKDIRDNLEDLGMFDFIWVRFVLEYYLSNSFEIVKNISRILKPGGVLCLIDLDYNCLSHFGLPQRQEKALHEIMAILEKDFDFDPYVGRKLYSFLYDLNCQDIDVNIEAHHLIFGKLKEADDFNWTKKFEVAAKKSGYRFEDYIGGNDEFFEEFQTFFNDPRRFTYTPVIFCKGYKPTE
ncbi:class I SAM-dependent methyltransferase [Thermodesulfobacteriota bacterium]